MDYAEVFLVLEVGEAVYHADPTAASGLLRALAHPAMLPVDLSVAWCTKCSLRTTSIDINDRGELHR